MGNSSRKLKVKIIQRVPYTEGTIGHSLYVPSDGPGSWPNIYDPLWFMKLKNHHSCISWPYQRKSSHFWEILNGYESLYLLL